MSSPFLNQNFNLFAGATKPFIPMNLTTLSLKHNRTTVKWHVPLYAYDPETYRIIYGMGPLDLSLTSNDVYNITYLKLVNLIPRTTYYFKVVAINSKGNTISSISSFTTSNPRKCVCVCMH